MSRFQVDSPGYPRQSLFWMSNIVRVFLIKEGIVSCDSCREPWRTNRGRDTYSLRGETLRSIAEPFGFSLSLHLALGQEFGAIEI